MERLGFCRTLLLLLAVLLVACGGAETVDPSVTQVTLNISDVTELGAALTAQIAAGDGNGIDNFFRNSGVVVDTDNGLYYAVNGVHPVNSGDYTSYYPKSIVAASLESDEIVEVYSFSQVNGHDVDMEALTFANSHQTIYVGDEYNFIYELDLDTGTILREWNIAEVGIQTAIDRGIEALTYSSTSGYFYAGIQETGQILVLDLHGEAQDVQVTLIDTFDVGSSPSGLFAHESGAMYMVTVDGGRDSSQRLYQYNLNGDLTCLITIPSELGMTRPDGVYIDANDEYIYLADSQGPIYDGSSLYRIAWTDPCDNAAHTNPFDGGIIVSSIVR